jgi:hypothetical protein
MPYTHRDKDGMLWRFEGSRPISRLADEVMANVKTKPKLELVPTVEYSRDKGKTWDVWAYGHPGPDYDVAAKAQVARMRRLYAGEVPKWRFRVGHRPVPSRLGRLRGAK